MKTILGLLSAAYLSGCAISGLEGPQRQAQAREGVRYYSGQLVQSLNNTLSLHGGGYYNPQLSQIQNEADWNALEEHQALRQIQYNLNGYGSGVYP